MESGNESRSCLVFSYFEFNFVACLDSNLRGRVRGIE